jgi:sugar phosphate isomerase/epimerase
MKLSVITDEISQDFEHALDVMAEYNVRSAELRGLWGVNIGDLDPSQVRRARRALADRGMTVCSLSTPIYKCELETDEAAVAGRMHLARPRGVGEQMDLLKRCIELAHAFDTTIIRTFTFWRHGSMTPQIEAAIVAAYEQPAQLAGDGGVTLAVENEHACYVGTGVEVARVVQAIASEHVKVCWDPGNALCAGELPYPSGYEAVAPNVVHMHVKDATLDADGRTPRWCVIGEGVIDYRGQFDALRRDGYTGHISLETHYVPKDGTPEDGSRPCLAALRRFIED